MRGLRFVSSVILLVVLAGAGAAGVLAAPPDAPSTPINNTPATALHIDGTMQTIPGNSESWYRFDYRGDQSQMTVTLLNGTDSGLGFKVFTTPQVQDWWETTPVGQGTAQVVLCSDSRPATQGTCLANDLTWVSHSKEGGAYYVLVANHRSSPMTFQLGATGDGVVS